MTLMRLENDKGIEIKESYIITLNEFGDRGYY